MININNNNNDIQKFNPLSIQYAAYFTSDKSRLCVCMEMIHDHRDMDGGETSDEDTNQFHTNDNFINDVASPASHKICCTIIRVLSINVSLCKKKFNMIIMTAFNPTLSAIPRTAVYAHINISKVKSNCYP